MNGQDNYQLISEMIRRLDQFPYGMIRRDKTIPPNRHMYAALVDKLIEALVSVTTDEFLSAIDYLRSIRDNEVRMLIISKDNNFAKYNEDEEMARINRAIHMHLDNYLEKIESTSFH